MSTLTPRSVRNKRCALARLQAGIPAPTLTPADPIRAHIRELRRWGMSIRSISAASGVPPQTLTAIIYGSVNRTLRHVVTTTAGPILALTFTVEGLPAGALINATGTARRMHALSRLGWPGGYLAARIGMSTANYRSLADQERVTVRTYKQIAGLYNELSGKQGPSSRARLVAERNGHPLPAAWDDDTIDDPAAEPQHDARLTREQIRDEAVRLVGAGETYGDVAEVLGCSEQTVERAVARAERGVA